MMLEDIIEQNLTIALEQLKTDAELLDQIQKRLSILQLYPSDRIDGIYGPMTEGAIAQFCDAENLDNLKIGKFDRTFAEALMRSEVPTSLLTSDKSRDRIFSEYFRAEAGYGAEKLAFLDRSIDKSPYKVEIWSYPSRLTTKPDEREVISSGETMTLYNSSTKVTFKPYPTVGQLPQIDTKALSFIHPDITEACVCIGSFVGGELRARWLGRNALSNVQFWSSTKFIPILNVVCKANSKMPTCDLDNCVVRNRATGASFKFHDLVTDVATYKHAIGSSNALAVMFKRFETYGGLENWLKTITGNKLLQFRGTYGESPFIYSPELFDQKLQKVVLKAAAATEIGNNLMSAYDLTRTISMLGWHYYLPQAARLPGAQWNSLESVVRGLAKDSARYVDVAIEKLGLQSVLNFPVILSKMGFGRSSSRNRTELTYVAFVQFVDSRPKKEGKPAKFRTMAIALRGGKALGDADKEAIEIDARMAAEVTEIIRRVVMEELA